ncbi:uncharacterized protein L201_006558 [Kwoniella dendrophila CBS 6074]|uniref:Uncharacterized protein n=1 Tax=Kwoniella dendrophila CBS 6074 TaxID=1295534 RepID=A0AAX4K263_9TREE
MPIPTRPIPVHPRHHHHHHNQNRSNSNKPGSGSSVPKKYLQNSLDWRSEIALLNELGSKSVPSSTSHQHIQTKLSGLGVKLIQKKDIKLSDQVNEQDVKGKRDVNLEDLIEDCKGKREKRATTATTLGFDFIPNPTILTLPDTIEDDSSSLSLNRKSSLLSTSKSTPTPNNTANLNHLKNQVESPLQNTPVTPGLIAQADSPISADEEEEEDEDDWEYVPSVSKKKDNNIEGDEEDDMIILGELELEDNNDHNEVLNATKEIKGGKNNHIKGTRTSYAGILGTA